MSDVFLGIDLGTTGVRCVAFDSTLGVLASEYVESSPTVVGGAIEQHPDAWWDAVVAVTSAVVRRLPDARAVRALAVSSQGITVVPVDAAGAALRPAISWLDQRGEGVLQELASRLAPEALTDRTGLPFLGSYTLPKLLWLALREPEIAARAAGYWLPHDDVVFRLTGRAVTDHTLAGGTMAHALATRDWDDEALSAVGVRRDQLPELCEAGTPVGTLRPAVASALGLSASVVVGVGGQDQKCAALAAGISPGTMTLSLGTAAALETLVADASVPPGVPVFPFGVGDGFVREVSTLTAGAAYRWFANTDGGGASFDELNARVSAALALDASRQRPYFLPQLARVGIASDAERWPVDPSGVFWGLTLDTSPDDLAAAVLEGVTCEIDAQRRRAGSDAGTIRVFGGGAQGDVWCQLIADVTGLRVEALATHEAAAAGAALLGMMACDAAPRSRDAGPRLPVAGVREPSNRSAEMAERAAKHAELSRLVYGG
jgi:xylulokinase